MDSPDQRRLFPVAGAAGRPAPARHHLNFGRFFRLTVANPSGLAHVGKIEPLWLPEGWLERFIRSHTLKK
jgi:hypothetical protein